jgi:tetratricopeptide (TPR) repeat protein
MKVSLSARVDVRREAVFIPTYEPLPPDKNPMFLEKRVYQGSSGRVYPLPFYDRIAEEKTDRTWQAIFLENEFVEVMILPEIGGKIHAARDKTNGYDFFYRQEVIKPALVGLAGPWISGGVEFNWPQHHRPATFMPVDVVIERHDDGSVTVWCSDHDPMQRMKGMHGVCLHPDRSVVELKVRAHNRTHSVQTFLWWANVATRVHEDYQSFFPPDVSYVADHARRSMSTYPLASGHYYGIDYAARARKGVPKEEAPAHYAPPASGGKTAFPYKANDLSYYANIPVPTSYMCMGSEEDFFGGYDHRARAGVVHVANHHISPGKKQWTWGNHEFGYAWDRSLTDPDANVECVPYIEIMAGVYTDNQPDFAFLMPGETKTWSQFWYPIQEIGPASHANTEAAVNLAFSGKEIRLGVAVTRPFTKAVIRLERDNGSKGWEKIVDLAPGKPFTTAIPQGKNPWKEGATTLHLLAADGSTILSWHPVPRVEKPVPDPATEPPSPSAIAGNEELYLTGLHLRQYRHATRDPVPYWEEAVRRDPGDSRCNNALGLHHLERGEFAVAEALFRKAIARLTLRNANPYDGEPLYNLGLTLRHLGRDKEAYDAFYKGTWNQSWQAASYHALAEIDCSRADWMPALDHLDRSLCLNVDNLGARSLRVLVLRRMGHEAEASESLSTLRKLDPLDWWSRHLAGEKITCDTKTRLDLVLDHVRSGFLKEALALLEDADPEPFSGTAPLVSYYRAWIHGLMGNAAKAKAAARAAAKASPDHCFPARLEEIAILEHAIRLDPRDPRAPYYLGNLFYHRQLRREAIALWEKAASLDPRLPTVWRNLGIAYYNVLGKPSKAKEAYEKAFQADPKDARLLYERDQLWKRLGVLPGKRLSALEQHAGLVARRDDLTVEICTLYNQTGQPAKALRILSGRNFQPWEGGEGQALGQHVRTLLALGRKALEADDTARACEHFGHALTSPQNLSEAKHLLANQSDIHYWLGVALDKAGEKRAAKHHWTLAATFRGDFQEMSVHPFSEMTYYSALAWEKLGKKAKATRLLRDLLAHAKQLEKAKASIDYFATSLPTMLLFDDDIQKRQETSALFLQAQAELGLGNKAKGTALLREVLRREPNHAFAADLMATKR